MALLFEFRSQHLGFRGMWHWGLFAFVLWIASFVLFGRNLWVASFALLLGLIAFAWYWSRRANTTVRCQESGFTVTTSDGGHVISAREYAWSDVSSMNFEEIRPIEGSDLDVMRIYVRRALGTDARHEKLTPSEMAFEANSDSAGFPELRRIFEAMAPHLTREVTDDGYLLKRPDGRSPI